MTDYIERQAALDALGERPLVWTEDDYYSLKEYPDMGIIYVDDKYDPYFPKKIALTTDDHQINYIMLRNNDLFINAMKELFSKGCFRFKNLKCKNAILKAFSF